MDKLIGPFQSNFLKNRHTSDNAIIVQEIVNMFRQSKRKIPNMILKIDLKKAFDKLEWSFIYDTLHHFGFPSRTIQLIISFITTIKVAILINGTRTPFFTPSRGIRQGGPLSTYIFILCMKMLSKKIEQDVTLKH